MYILLKCLVSKQQERTSMLFHKGSGVDRSVTLQLFIMYFLRQVLSLFNMTT